jgi:hypothetical protein
MYSFAKTIMCAVLAKWFCFFTETFIDFVNNICSVTMKRPIAYDACAVSKVLVVAITFIVVVAGVAGVYYLSLPSPPKINDPYSQSTANFQARTHVEYLLKAYDINGSVSSQSQAKWSVDEGVFNKTSCWLLGVDNSETSPEGVKSEVILTVYLSKSTLERVHVKAEMFLDGELVFGEEVGPDSNSYNDMIPMQFPAQYVAYETVTVPAGTFVGCGKVSDTDSGSVFNAWIHKDVPVWGIVKMESYQGETLVSTMELMTYG